MQSCPLIKTSKVNICNHALHFCRIKIFLQLLKITLFSCPEKLLVVLLLWLPPISPCRLVYGLPVLLCWCAALELTIRVSISHHLRLWKNIFRKAAYVLVVTNVIHSPRIFVNNHKRSLLVVNLSHVDLVVVCFIFKEFCQVLVLLDFRLKCRLFLLFFIWIWRVLCLLYWTHAFYCFEVIWRNGFLIVVWILESNSSVVRMRNISVLAENLIY